MIHRIITRSHVSVTVACVSAGLVTLTPARAAAEGPMVYLPPTAIATGAVGSTERILSIIAVNNAAMLIERLHSCAIVTTWEDVGDMIKLQQMRELLGGPTEDTNLEEIGSAMGARYILGTTLTRLHRGHSIGYTLVDARRQRVLARELVSVPPDEVPAITPKVMKEIVKAIPACQLDMEIQISVAGSIGPGRGGGAFSGKVELEADDGGRITGEGAVAGGMAMADAPVEDLRDKTRVAFKVPVKLTGTRDEENIADLRTTGGIGSYSALNGGVSGSSASGGSNSVRMRWRAGQRAVLSTRVQGGTAVTAFTLRVRTEE